MFITADQLLAHLVGDYTLQSDWMANNKYSKLWVALVHGTVYTLPFLFITHSVFALVFIGLSHTLIDHFRVARYISWIKNYLSVPWLTWCDYNQDGHVGKSVCGSCRVVRNLPWNECNRTGYPNNRPDWLAVWLMIIVDNIMHIMCNGLAIKYLSL